jgi:hypothetical protein
LLGPRKKLGGYKPKGRESEFFDEEGGAFLFLVGVDKIVRDCVCARTVLNQSSTTKEQTSSTVHLLTHSFWS